MASLSQDTKTTLGVTALCVSAFLGGAAWINTSIGEVEKGLTGTNSRLDMIEYRLKALESSSDDRWRRTDMKAWIRDFRERNPTMSIPSVD
jgi:hypothetical protein